MVATCPNCSKQLKVKDEWAGKMLKCPACSKPFKAGGGAGLAGIGAGPRPVSGGAGAKPQKSNVAPKAKFEKYSGSSVSMNWGQLITWGLLAMIPVVILLVIFGPIRVYRNWTASQNEIEDQVRDVLDFAVKCEASHSGAWNPRKSGAAPAVPEIRFLPDLFRMSNPETVKFDGHTSNGTFEGVYTFATGEVEATLKLGGVTLPSGIHVSADGTASIEGGGRVKAPTIPGRRKATEEGEVKITGRVKSGAPTAELDGKKADIYFPPEVDEDGNPIVPDPPATKPTK